MAAEINWRKVAEPLGVAVALVVFVGLTIGPVVWLLVSSFMEQQALTATPPDFGSGAFTTANYVEVLEAAASLKVGLLNSMVIATATTAIAVTIGAPAAYALARLQLPKSDFIVLMVLAAQMFPAVVIAIPLFIVASKLNILDTKINLVLVYLSFNLPVVIWVLRGFFLVIPRGLERAAAIDGATTFQTFLLVVLPISLPPLLAASVFAFIEAWNEFFFALIMTRQSTQTVPLVIASFAGQYQTAFGQMMAAAAISIAPVVILSLIMRNYLLRGFADGMLKG